MENNIDQNHEQWVNLHNQSRYHPKYPVEEVVQFCFRNYRENRENVKILDAGCGAGRHVKFLADEGFVPYGIDFSDSGVDYTKKILSEAGYKNFSENIFLGSIKNLPFENDYFDSIICWGVLYYLSEEEIKKSIHEFFRVLKKNGKMLLYVRTIEDYRYVSSFNRDGFYATINEGDSSRASSSENGMTLFFFERSYVSKLFENLGCVIEIERITKTIENEHLANDNFLITVEKN